MQEKIGNITLNLDYYPGEDLYSDGAVEDELVQIARDNDSEQLKTVIDEKKSWPVLYHFSDQRENIVDWLPITKNDKVLEVGSGCGAITGALSRKARSVTCVDLSKKRSLVNAYRHKDADNITIHLGNFRDVEPHLDNDYDYVCLIGVFEYGQSYMESEKPFHEFLNILKKHVKPDGRIVIAIENKLGLKYFAGCKEDHLGTWFSGIENYVNEDYVRTFSKNGLEKIFEECGVKDYHFYYPYPDYKFPTMIFSDKRLPQKGELSNNLRNFDRERLLLFNEKKAFDGLIEDGLFPVFSNSYMVILGPDTDVNYARFSNERDSKYAIATFMTKDKSGEVSFKKYPLDEKAYEHIYNLHDTYEALAKKYKGGRLEICPCKIENVNGIPVASFDFVRGKTLNEMFDEKLKRNDMKAFASLFEEFVSRIDYGKDEPISDLDLVFSNVIVDEDRWTVIDYEWVLKEKQDVKYQAYRALYCYMQEDESREKADLSMCLDLIGASPADKDEYIDREKAFHRNVQNSRFSLAQLREEIGEAVIHPEKYVGENAAKEKVERVQIYTDKGQGYSEDNSYFVKKALYDNGNLSFEVSFGDDVKNLRIDPMMGAGVVYVDSLTINGNPLPDMSKRYLECNGRRLRGDYEGFVFETDDPNMNIHLEGIALKEDNILEARFSYAYMSEKAAHGILTSVKRLI